MQASLPAGAPGSMDVGPDAPSAANTISTPEGNPGDAPASIRASAPTPAPHSAPEQPPCNNKASEKVLASDTRTLSTLRDGLGRGPDPVASTTVSPPPATTQAAARAPKRVSKPSSSAARAKQTALADLKGGNIGTPTQDPPIPGFLPAGGGGRKVMPELVLPFTLPTRPLPSTVHGTQSESADAVALTDNDTSEPLEKSVVFLQSLRQTRMMHMLQVLPPFSHRHRAGTDYYHSVPPELLPGLEDGSSHTLISLGRADVHVGPVVYYGVRFWQARPVPKTAMPKVNDPLHQPLQHHAGQHNTALTASSPPATVTQHNQSSPPSFNSHSTPTSGALGSTSTASSSGSERTTAAEAQISPLARSQTPPPHRVPMPLDPGFVARLQQRAEKDPHLQQLLQLARTGQLAPNGLAQLNAILGSLMVPTPSATSSSPSRPALSVAPEASTPSTHAVPTSSAASAVRTAPGRSSPAPCHDDEHAPPPIVLVEFPENPSLHFVLPLWHTAIERRTTHQGARRILLSFLIPAIGSKAAGESGKNEASEAVRGMLVQDLDSKKSHQPTRSDQTATQTDEMSSTPACTSASSESMQKSEASEQPVTNPSIPKAAPSGSNARRARRSSSRARNDRNIHDALPDPSTRVPKPRPVPTRNHELYPVTWNITSQAPLDQRLWECLGRVPGCLTDGQWTSSYDERVWNLLKGSLRSRMASRPPEYTLPAHLLQEDIPVGLVDHVSDRYMMRMLVNTSRPQPKRKVAMLSETKDTPRANTASIAVRAPVVSEDGSVPVKPKRKRHVATHNPDGSIKSCGACGKTKTPMWRRGPKGPSQLCNACGAKWKAGRLVVPDVPPPPILNDVMPIRHVKQAPPSVPTPASSYVPLDRSKLDPSPTPPSSIPTPSIDLPAKTEATSSCTIPSATPNPPPNAISATSSVSMPTATSIQNTNATGPTSTTPPPPSMPPSIVTNRNPLASTDLPSTTALSSPTDALRTTDAVCPPFHAASHTTARPESSSHWPPQSLNVRPPPSSDNDAEATT